MSNDIPIGEVPSTADRPWISYVRLGRIRAGAQPMVAGRGANETYFGIVYTDDGDRPAYIKDLDLTQLVNEVSAACLAMAAALPVPAPHIVAVMPNELTLSKAPTLEDGVTRLAFASVDAAAPPIRQLVNSGALPAEVIVKWPEFAKAACFDEWIANCDRHDGNLLFDGDGRYYLIDHGHSFTGPSWAAANLRPDATVSNQLLEGWPKAALSDDLRISIAKAADGHANSFGEVQPTKLLDSDPIKSLLSDDRFNALINFVGHPGLI